MLTFSPIPNTCSCRSITCDVCGVAKHPGCRRECQSCHDVVGRQRDPVKPTIRPMADWGFLPGADRARKHRILFYGMEEE